MLAAIREIVEQQGAGRLAADEDRIVRPQMLGTDEELELAPPANTAPTIAP